MSLFFESIFFEKRKFEEKTIKKYFFGAERDFKIARENKDPEVVFKFSYDCLIKLGITLIVSQGYRIKSRTGHHIKILEKEAKEYFNFVKKIIAESERFLKNQISLF